MFIIISFTLVKKKKKSKENKASVQKLWNGSVNYSTVYK